MKANSELRLRPIGLITWSGLLEIKRRKDVYVLSILIGLYLVFVLVTRIVGIDSEETARFLLNLGLSVAFFLAAVLTASAAGRQLSSEWEDRTIYPLLAKPVSRLEVILGKWVAVVIAGSIVMLVLSLLTLFSVPKIAGLSYLLLMETLIAQTLALAVLSGLVLGLSLWLSRPLVILLGIACYSGSGIVIGILKNRLGGGENGILAWVIDYIPNFSLLDLCGQFTNGGDALGILPMATLVLYGVIFAGGFLAATTWFFQRKSL
jgi:ABC-type transport system involved in multi-copper enzyme maturation permease subunit